MPRRCLPSFCHISSAIGLSFLALCLAAFGDGFYVTPHIQNVTKDGVTIIWESQEECVGSVEYGLEGKFDQKVTESQPAKIHRVRISGLTPETVYSYRVRAGADEKSASFKTAPAVPRPVTFVVVGDSRRWEKRWEETGMAQHMMQWNPEFMLNVGDLVLRGHDYNLWPEHFNRFAGILDRIMMVTARGNHEGSRTKETDQDWFAKYHELPGKGEPFSVFDWGNLHLIAISYEDVNDCLADLEQDLAASKNKHIIVSFHYPVYCTGYYSPEDSRKETGKSLAAVAALLDKYNVKLHIAGHTHIYERTYPLRNAERVMTGTTYVIQGGDINANFPAEWTAVADDRDTMSKPGYTLVSCLDDRIELRTFCWSTKENKIVEIDHAMVGLSDDTAKTVLAALPSTSDADLPAAIEKIGAMMHGPAAELLMPYMKNSDAEVRRAATKAIRSIGVENVAESMLEFVTDTDTSVAREAARAIEIAMPEKLAPKVAGLAEQSGLDEYVRASLIGALQLHAPRKTVAKTAIAILDGDAPAKVRNRAAYALSEVAEKQDVKSLAKLFEKEPESFAMLRLAFTLNELTATPQSLKSEGPLAQSKPGERSEFVKKWLKGK